jgi:uncharacterized membrane protein
LNRKLKRLLWQNVGFYYYVLLAFAIGAVLTQNYILAAAEAGVTLVLFIGYLIYHRRKNKDL